MMRIQIIFGSFELTESCTFRVTACPTFSGTGTFDTFGLKLFASTRNSYSPGSMSEKTYSPWSFVKVSRRILDALSVVITVAPAITAPAGSVTVPVSVARAACWANAGEQTRKNTRTARERDNAGVI